MNKSKEYLVDELDDFMARFCSSYEENWEIMATKFLLQQSQTRQYPVQMDEMDH